jgi:hypothetical protein
VISLRKFLGGSWETVRDYLQSDLEAIETSFNTLVANSFNDDGTIAPSAFPGESDAATRYIANTGTNHAPKWDQVELSNGVKGRLPFANLVPASRGGVLVGRQNNIRGDFGEIYLGAGLRMSGNVLEAVPAPPAASPEENFATGGIPGPMGPQGPAGPMGPPGRDGMDGGGGDWSMSSVSSEGNIFTPGSVIFAGASGILAQDNAGLFWDDTNNILTVASASALAAVETDGLVLSNATAATGGVLVQMPPRLKFAGSAWNGATADAMTAYLEWLPQSGTTRGQIKFGVQRNGASTTYPVIIDSNPTSGAAILTLSSPGAFRGGDGSAASPVFGFVNSGGGSAIGFWTPAANDMDLVCGGANQILWGASLWRNSANLLMGWSSNADPNNAVADTAFIRQAAAKIKFYNKPETTPDAGFTLDFSVDSVARFRDRADSTDVVVKGAGYAFPGTQIASADANTLDDYEEGTWTPSDGSGAALSFAGVNATYVKVGQAVHVSFQFTFPATASGAAIVIAGLPFAVENSGVSDWGGAFTYTTLAQSNTLLAVNNSTTFAVFTNAGVGVTNAAYTGQVFNGFLVYRAAA